MTTNARKKKNLITHLLDYDIGNLVHTYEGLCDVTSCYFTTLFIGQNIDMEATISHAEKKIGDDDNCSLLALFLIEEFKFFISHMRNDKYLDPNGLNPTFYKKFQDDLGDDIFSTATMWLNQGIFPLNLNNTDIVLIPKKAIPHLCLI